MRRSEDFQMTIRHGVRARTGTLVVHGREVPGRRETHVGLVVSGAVGGAVTRNLVRRRLRGVVVGQRASLPIGTDLVVRALPAAAGTEYGVLATDFTGALTRLSARMGAGGGVR